MSPVHFMKQPQRNTKRRHVSRASLSVNSSEWGGFPGFPSVLTVIGSSGQSASSTRALSPSHLQPVRQLRYRADKHMAPVVVVAAAVPRAVHVNTR